MLTRKLTTGLSTNAKTKHTLSAIKSTGIIASMEPKNPPKLISIIKGVIARFASTEYVAKLLK